MTEQDDAIYGAAAGGGKFDPLWDEFVRVCEQRDLLLVALEAVEWGFDAFGNNICGWCHEEKFGGHAPDCRRQATIAAVMGEE